MSVFGVKRLHSTLSDPGQGQEEDSDTDIDDNAAKRASSQQLNANVNEEMHNPRYRPWTKADRDSFITRFEDEYGRQIESDAAGTYDTDGPELYNFEEITYPLMTFMYFIGRLNPPHDGHINGLVALITTANEKGSIPLILLGSGPGGQQTMDNPITFQNKYDFITAELAQAKYNNGRGFIEGVNYNIKQMTNPARDVSEYVALGLSRASINPDNPEVLIARVSGEKGDDITKLNFVEKAGVAAAIKITGKKATSSVIGVSAKASSAAGGEAMSATEVRKDVYKTIINGLGYAGWPKRYKDFYGRFARVIYDVIARVAIESGMPAIRAYLGLAPEGGGSRRKSKTKKRSNLKKRRTQRKKRRTTRRK